MNVLRGRRHLAATAPSLRKVRSKSLSLLLVGALLPTLPVPVVRAADLGATYAEMQGAPEQVLPSAPQLGGPAGCATTASSFTQATPTPILDVAVVTSTLVVSGAGTSLFDLDLTTFITHTFAADLDITLRSPAGTVVTLTTDNGGGNDNVFNGTVWDDNANPGGQVPYVTNAGLATDHPYVNLTLASPLVPEESMAAFIGEDPNGTWTITISDDLGGDVGSLDRWTLNLNTLPGPPTTTTATFTQPTPTAIPTGPAVVTSTLAVPAGGAIFKVTARTNLTHTFNADLDITLLSPAGTVVTLTTDNGAGNDNVFNGTVWDDDANPGGQVPYVTNNGLVSDHLYVNLTLASPLVPEETMGAFIGEDQSGTWTITISDDLAGDGGSLDSWSLDITTGSCLSVAPFALRVDAGGNGVFEPNETAVMAPVWQNRGTTAITLTGATSGFTGPAGPTYTNPDSTGAYGTIAGGGQAACTDCYTVNAAAATRPATHWDSTILETVTPTATAKTWTLHVGGSFTDVPLASGFYPFIETILHKNVTGGCTATTYCPTNSTTRDQMAVFVLVSKEPPGYTPPACGATPMFPDVPVTNPFCRWIEELARRGVVSGCGGGNYCPTDSATREQMSVFVLRTLDPALNPPACVAGSEMFADVPATNPFCRWIEELARRGVVSGCGGGNYCPTAAVSREQMGVFLSVTFGLVLYGP